MTAEPRLVRVPFNTALADRVSRTAGSALSGSLYAVPPGERRAAARFLSARGIWVHVDVFDDDPAGADLVRDLAEHGAGPLDVHLLNGGAMDRLDAVCRPGVARVTFPFEGVSDPAAVAARVRAAGAVPWLAVAPETSLSACADALSEVDGLLVMLIAPGTRGESDPALLGKARRAATALPVGVDGGVGEHNLDAVLAAGVAYVVVGRRLFAAPAPFTEEER
ncbi:hypothetical protein [Amycolatopsis sp. NPDC003676]